jgi:urocanate hydratase
MALDHNSSAAIRFTLDVERFYAGLVHAAKPGLEPALGGNLLYAGELDQDGRALVVAGNIAGTASLATTADETAQKQAVRDGVVDFLVNSLDEALRILKNEIRKREAVAVLVAGTTASIELEMLERGVLPDLPRPARQLETSAGSETLTRLIWSVSAAPAEWLPRLDAIAIDCLPPENLSARRWVRLAPRYLGRLAQGVRVLSCSPESASEFVERVNTAVVRGEIAVEVRIEVSGSDNGVRFPPV